MDTLEFQINEKAPVKELPTNEESLAGIFNFL